MALYNAKCPICGTENKKLDLDETNGWMECECCKNVCIPTEYFKNIAKRCVKIPVYTMEQLGKAYVK